MSQPEGQNPEHRSNVAILLFCGGIGLGILAQVLGIGAIFGAVLSGNDPAIVVGSLFAVIALAMLGFGAFVMMAVGGIWMVIQVIADQRGEPSEKRYRDVER